MWTAGIQMKWVVTIAVNRNLSNCENSPKKKDSSVWVFIAQLGEHCSANAEATVRIPLKPRKSFFSGYFRNCLNCDSLRWSQLISFVFPQFTSFHSVFHSFHGLMNSINWPASSVWVFIAQLGEHCSANAEATGSNPVEAPKVLFFGLFSQLLKLRFTAMVTTHFICIPAVHIISFNANNV